MCSWRMSACLSVVIAACGVFVTMGGTAWGQEPGFSPQPAPPEEFAADQFSRARVVEVLHEQERDLAGYPQLLQLVAAELLGGPQAGRRISAEYVAQAHGTQRRVAPGDIVIVAGSTTGGQTAYYVVEPYRLSFLTVMFILFIGLAILLGRLRGAMSLDEIGKANPALPVRELYRRGFSVGTEHITALVNTLFLAYAGASLPLFLLFTQTDQPLWVIVNSEFVAEEIVRTLVGSIALMLAVPITTLLAAVVLHSRHSTTSPAG